MEAVKLVKIYVGTNTNDNECDITLTYTLDSAKRAVQKLVYDYTSIDSYTIYTGQGMWQEKGEKTIILEIIVPCNPDLEETLEDLHELCTHIEDTLHQACVLMLVGSDALLV